ncbi:uncharacterized protein METZ01_LOCUS416800, partial [marine metagenome]
VDFHTDGLMNWFAGVADALEATVANGGGLPAEQAGDVEVAILEVEAATARAGKKAAGQRNRAAVGAIPHDVHHRAAPVRKMQQFAAE